MQNLIQVESSVTNEAHNE